MIGAEDVGPAVAVEVGRDHVVRTAGGDHLALPGQTAAAVELDDDLLRALSLVHVSGNHVEFPVAIKFGQGERMHHGFRGFSCDYAPGVGVRLEGGFFRQTALPEVCQTKRISRLSLRQRGPQQSFKRLGPFPLRRKRYDPECPLDRSHFVCRD